MELFEDRKKMFLFFRKMNFQLYHYLLAFCDCKKHTKSCKLNIALIFFKLPSILYIDSLQFAVIVLSLTKNYTKIKYRVVFYRNTMVFRSIVF